MAVMGELLVDGDILVFVEVKTRSSDLFGPPESFVTPRKEQLLADAAAVYMDRCGHSWEIRFDIISVLVLDGENYSIDHFEDAFFPSI